MEESWQGPRAPRVGVDRMQDRGKARDVGRRFQTAAALAAFVLPTALLAWIGLQSLREDTQRGAERYRARAEGLCASFELALAEEIARATPVDDGAAAVILRFDADGTLRTELPAAPAPDVAGDATLMEALTSELDRLQASGRTADAIARLEDVAAQSTDPVVAAWALDACAALQDASDAVDAARRTRERLVADHPTSRNGRGLLRSLAARRALLGDVESDGGAWVELYRDACADLVSREQTAAAQFVREVRMALADVPAEQRSALESVDQADARAALRRAVAATARRGITDWFARGAPGARALFAAPPPAIASVNPLSIERADDARAAAGWLWVFAEREGDGWRGVVGDAAALLESVLVPLGGDPATLAEGFELSVGASDGPTGQSLARRRLQAPFDSFAVSVGGGDFARFLESERRRFLFSASLVALAIASAALGAWFTLRGVAREVDAARGREAFVAAVTHELKTPLASIRLFAEMLARGDVEPAKVSEFGRRTVSESDRLARLVDSVLDSARIEQSNVGAPTDRVELDDVVARASAVVDGVARERGCDIRVARAAEPCVVVGDAEALVRAVVNLLDNAMKYSPQGSAIDVEILRDGSNCVLRVLDRGRGVPEAERQRIFEPFRRLGDESRREAPGVGLGLALVAKIASSHAGSARCLPREGGGSCFELRLPSAPAEANA